MLKKRPKSSQQHCDFSVTQNSFMNSKRTNWPKPAQISGSISWNYPPTQDFIRVSQTSIYQSYPLQLILILADCSLNYKFNHWKFQAQTWGEHVVWRNCFRHSEQFLYTTCSPHILQKEELLTKIYLYFIPFKNIVNWQDQTNSNFYNVTADL